MFEQFLNFITLTVIMILTFSSDLLKIEYFSLCYNVHIFIAKMSLFLTESVILFFFLHSYVLCKESP